MNFNGGSSANNYNPTSNSYASTTTYTTVNRSLAGTYFTEASAPLSIRPLSGITYPRYS